MERGNPSTLADDGIDLAVSDETWEKLLGSRNWEGLLHPLNLSLRKFILLCGDFCHSASDAFHGVSPGQSVQEVKLPKGYQCHSPLYATTTLSRLEMLLLIPDMILSSDSSGEYRLHQPHWMGYCAFTTDEASRARGRREVYIAWRGTQRLFEWKNNLLMSCKSASCLLRDPNEAQGEEPTVMKGWLGIYNSTEDWEPLSKVTTSAREQVKGIVQELMERYQREKISIVVTGHSLGAILAILTAFDIAENLVGEEVRVAAVVFGCPRVGNSAFRERVQNRSNLKVLHIKNKRDLVTWLPPARRVGKELVVDSHLSELPMLRDSKGLGEMHDLETCLHMVSGWHGPDRKFEKQVPRKNDRLTKKNKAFKYVGFEIRSWIERMSIGIEFVLSSFERMEDRVGGRSDSENSVTMKDTRHKQISQLQK